MTALCESAITYVDGDAGILEHRGYPIEQLAEQSSYLEVAYLLTHGKLPTAAQLAAWNAEIAHHAMIEEKFVERFVAGFHHGAHPMGMLVSAVAALSTFYPESKDIADPANRHAPADPPHREDADARRRRAPLLGRQAVRPPGREACRSARTSSR